MELLTILQEITNNASTNSNILLGEVVSTSPLKIKVDQKFTVDEEFIILSRNVTDYDVEMSVDHLTEKAVGGSGYAMYASHEHQYKGRKKFTVHNALEVGESVIIYQTSDGQRFYVLDRVGS